MDPTRRSLTNYRLMLDLQKRMIRSASASSTQVILCLSRGERITIKAVLNDGRPELSITSESSK